MLFVALGLAFAIGAGRYDMGTASRMGPGYIPRVLGGMLAVLGLIIAGGALRSRRPPVGAIPLRPLVLVTLSIVLFAVSLKHAGLVVSSLLLVFVSSFAGREFRMLSTIILWLALVMFSVAVFRYGLGLPIPLWPSTKLLAW